MSKNVLYNYFSRCPQLYDLEGLKNEKVKVNWNPHIQTGQIQIGYLYKGLYVLFEGDVNNDKSTYKIYTRLSGFREMEKVSNATVLNENIPGFYPIINILQKYSLKRLIICGNMNA